MVYGNPFLQRTSYLTNYIAKNTFLQLAAQALTDEPEYSASERSRENACYK